MRISICRQECFKFYHSREREIDELHTHTHPDFVCRVRTFKKKRCSMNEVRVRALGHQVI